MEDGVTLSQQILNKAAQSGDQLERNAAEAMLSPDPVGAMAAVVGIYLHEEGEADDATIAMFCTEVNAGTHDDKIIAQFLELRPGLRRSDIEGYDPLAEPYFIISVIEDAFSQLHQDIHLVTHFAYPDPRIAENILDETLGRIGEGIKAKAIQD